VGNINLTNHIQGRSILEKVIPTVCSMERVIEKLIVLKGDYTKLKAWEKSCYRAYRLDRVMPKLLCLGASEKIAIIKDNILTICPQELGPNCIDIYVIAYAAENYGIGKKPFSIFIKEAGISDKDNSANAIWQVGKGDGVYLDLLNWDGTIKDREFFKAWLTGKQKDEINQLVKVDPTEALPRKERKMIPFQDTSNTRPAEYYIKSYCREDYLKEKSVQDFSDWVESKFDPAGVFYHSFYLAKAKRHWQCQSLYEAFENYWWGYSVYCTLNSNQIKGSSFMESFKYVEDLASVLRNAVKDGNNALAIKASLSMLSWGGVLLGNQKRIEELGSQICNYYTYVQECLNLKSVCLGLQNDIHINSGFTKLYFLLVDDFIMYDGRVGAALGLLGRLYAEDKGLAAIPDPVKVSFGSGKVAAPNTGENRRNPSTNKYKLPEFSGNRARHLSDNIKASWLLQAIADKTTSRFSLLPQDPPLNMRLTAIQSALFMVGYDVISYGHKGGDC
jgi:hypothetical protein